MRVKSVLVFLILLTAAPVSFGADAHEIWTAKVQPILDVQCAKCHGPIEQKSGFELDTPEAVLKGGDEGKVVVPGKPEESRMFKYLAADSDPHMPPKKQLTESEREAVREWITALGAEPVDSEEVHKTRDFASIPVAVDALIAEGWQKHKVEPAREAPESAWMRRVYLDLAGRIPTAPEANAFLNNPSLEKRSELVDRLLASKEYAVRMRELWDVYLLGRPKRDNFEERRRKSGWYEFLEYSFRENRPWNETVRDFLVARPEKEELKGAYWFLFERRDDYQRIAEAVAPVVYGARLDCAQCHDHPLAREIKQAHYWGLVAAYNRGKNVKDEGVAESAVGGYINFTNLKKESQPAVVALLTGKTLTETWPSGDKKEEDSDDKYVDPKAKVRVPKFSRREAFADAATKGNPLLARAFVNRMWSVLMGRGLVHPADEMNARNAPSHPKLLEWLARDFEKSNYDIKRLIRGLILNRVYALDRKDAPPEYFAGAIERPLTGEQLASSWRIAAGLEKEDHALEAAVARAIPDVLPKEYNATFQQAQFLENSPALARLLAPASGNTAEKLIALPGSQERAAAAFMAVFGRAPDAEELAAAAGFLEERAQDKQGAVRDLLWALMTSAEFLTMP
jgi:mono/diheme cytochrome c family protein